MAVSSGVFTSMGSYYNGEVGWKVIGSSIDGSTCSRLNSFGFTSVAISSSFLNSDAVLSSFSTMFPFAWLYNEADEIDLFTSAVSSLNTYDSPSSFILLIFTVSALPYSMVLMSEPS